MTNLFLLLLPLVVHLLLVLPVVHGHGRLIDPPSRSSMWRYGFDTPANYNDHESYCGGFTRQWQTNGGKCGICGDPWDEPQPRANEGGGRYGVGVISRKYRKNQAIEVRIELTANHMGHFEFKICPHNNPRKPASQSCLDRYLLTQSGGEGPNYYPGPGNKVFHMIYQLPKELTCNQCVLQWRYVAANNWGTCKNGTGKVGCGPQEEFRACSDVTITDDEGMADKTPNNDIDIINEIEDTPVILETDWEPIIDLDHIPEDNGGERLAVIILASILTVILMFGVIFLYYYKAKDHIKHFIKMRDIRFPTKIKVKSLCKLEKLGKINWPLSNIKFGDKLPSFINRSPIISHSPSPTDPTPIPPPRLKRNKSRSVSPNNYPRLATIVARPHPTRPPVPAPYMKANSPTVPLEISSPKDVTINGITVQSTSPMGQTAQSGPTPSSRGVICGPSTRMAPPPPPPYDPYPPLEGVCEARPALVLADQPDSSLEMSLSLEDIPLALSDIPPPLPSCPPPDSLVLEVTDTETEA